MKASAGRFRSSSGWVSEMPVSTRLYDWISDAESEYHGVWRFQLSQDSP